MSDVKFWGWNKKARTMIRFIKPGDIFCFRVKDNEYRFGRIISKFPTGHLAEIFNLTSSEPNISKEKLNNATRIFSPIILDSYMLFDRKIETDGDWRIIGHQEKYTPTDVDNIYFTYGIEESCKKIDAFGNITSISEKEALGIPSLFPQNDYKIKNLLLQY
ncbi:MULTISPECIES: immunity 26/phosphotriesterase HocA family protein [unclassified Pseudomonas]|uniref:immunity 26/phosphotriesterase HocA family protein n=1 Tax=unclassified Pseudomonas TaxID=196821 RepID=UPI000753C271|nr:MULTISPECIES: immunity 26/phosphotriesterase HocA family protein [unclassified Pseudomonas]KVV12599.1 hypothetical protein AP059_00071 [Pseudomonas sp. TAA207]KVV12604.1 hypothetical protein AP060_00077 [Pseudomonas sp. TAD18]MCF6391362.1 immunity 26/phosphotriesterase HocA family protein [Mycobacterium sp. MBM]